MSSPRTYTKDEKRQAIIRASTIGATAASVELAIPSGTLSVWLHNARKGLFAHLDLGDLVLKSTPSADVRAAAESPAAEGGLVLTLIIATTRSRTAASSARLRV